MRYSVAGQSAQGFYFIPTIYIYVYIYIKPQCQRPMQSSQTIWNVSRRIMRACNNFDGRTLSAKLYFLNPNESIEIGWTRAAVSVSRWKIRARCSSIYICILPSVTLTHTHKRIAQAKEWWCGRTSTQRKSRNRERERERERCRVAQDDGLATRRGAMAPRS